MDISNSRTDAENNAADPFRPRFEFLYSVNRSHFSVLECCIMGKYTRFLQVLHEFLRQPFHVNVRSRFRNGSDPFFAVSFEISENTTIQSIKGFKYIYNILSS